MLRLNIFEFFTRTELINNQFDQTFAIESVVSPSEQLILAEMRLLRRSLQKLRFRCIRKTPRERIKHSHRTEIVERPCRKAQWTVND